ncbi:MAG: S8 family serine peptidase [Candidatus Woesearchaeota archaeon]|nr:MAG: S8 family serine peptidase [Candidatus Woesearchaeota archaeon]
MKKLSKFILILILSINTILAFNVSLNETNTTIINNTEIMNSSESWIADVSPYKDKEAKEVKFVDLKYKPLNSNIDLNVKTKSKSLSKGEKIYSILQFNRNPSRSEITELKNEGIELLSYISSDTWYVSISQDLDNIFTTNDGGDGKLNSNNFNDKYLVRSLDEIKPEYKQSKYIRENKIGDWAKDDKGNVYLMVQFHMGVSFEKAETLVENMGGESLNKIKSINSLTISIPENKIDDLSNIDEVKRIGLVPPIPVNSYELASNNITKVSEIVTNPYNLTGDNILFLEYESGGVPENHADFKSRIQFKENVAVSDHATNVAGILIGNDSIFTGIASKGLLRAYKVPTFTTYLTLSDLDNDYNENVNNYHVDIISNSWEFSIDNSIECAYFGDYTLVTEFLDEAVRNDYGSNRAVPIIFAAGNARPITAIACGPRDYNSISPSGTAKNIITVGATNSNYSISDYSGFGPTEEGRIKPEIVAPGCIMSSSGNTSYATYCGTSQATPQVSGTIALMLEQWNKSGYDEDPLPSTIKALLLDSTTDLNRTGNGDQVIDGPDYVNGYGLLNAKGAVDRIINGTFLEANISDISDVDVYAINISAQSSLKVTLAWDDVPGANLINDLDLKLLSPSGQTFYPWTLDPNTPAREAWRNESDHLNNVEQVYVNTSEIESGQWLVVVSASDCNALDCPQKYSLVSEEELAPVSPFNNSYGLIGYWKGENTSLDSSANNKSATLGSAVTYTTSGPFGTAFDLPGTSGTSYLDLEIGTGIKTLSFWVNFRSGTGNKYLVTNSDVGYLGQGTVVNWPGDRTIDSLLGNGVYAFNDFGTLSLNTWYYVTFVSTGSGQEYYLNGAYKGLTVGAINSLSEASLYLGRHPTPSYEVNCLLDEISVWGVSLNQSSIYQLYAASMENFDTPTSPPSNSGLPANASLLGHWKGENSVIDNSSYRHDGSKGSSVTYNSWGIDGSSFDLPGTSGTSYLDLLINGTIKTLSFWVNFRSGSGNKYLVTNSDIGHLGQGTVLNWPGDRTIDALLGNGTYEYDAFGQLSLNTWHHVTFVSTSSGLQYYLNGTFIGSKSGTENTLPEASLYFGRHPTASYEVNCLLDEISVWNTSLNGDEVFQLFEEGIR